MLRAAVEQRLLLGAKHRLVEIVEHPPREMTARVDPKTVDADLLDHPPRVAHQEAHGILQHGIAR